MQSLRRAVALTIPSALGAAIAVWIAELGQSSATQAFAVAFGALAGAACAARIGLSPPPPEPTDARSAEETPAEKAPPPPPDPLGGGRAALEALPSPVLLIDRSGRLAFANRAATNELGRLQIGQHYAASLRAPGFFEAIEGIVGAAERRDGAQAAARQFSFSAHGRQERHVEAFVAPIVADDVDASVPDKERPAAAILLLDQTRARRSEQLHRDFVANASHELKTPLASIAGFIETLQGPARDDADARDRFLGIMAQQAERMRLLVNDLMSLNRIELNEHVAPRDSVDLRAALDAAAETVANGGGDLRIEWPDAGPVVRGDAGELTQLFANLISNAVKYGGDKRPPRVALLDDADRPERVGFVVEDHGPGIAREHLPRLTERFYRVDSPSGRQVRGTGLGLAIVKHVLARHRGELEIDSELGRGSRFQVWLPAPSLEDDAAAQAREAAKPVASERPAGGRTERAEAGQERGGAARTSARTTSRFIG
ncbi:MAG: ATP-binding protein [Pseudomonadota bacterium]